MVYNIFIHESGKDWEYFQSPLTLQGVIMRTLRTLFSLAFFLFFAGCKATISLAPTQPNIYSTLGGNIQTQQPNNPCPQGRHIGWQGNQPICEIQTQTQGQAVLSAVGTAQCPCVRTQWGRACGHSAYQAAVLNAKQGQQNICTAN